MEQIQAFTRHALSFGTRFGRGQVARSRSRHRRPWGERRRASADGMVFATRRRKRTASPRTASQRGEDRLSHGLHARWFVPGQRPILRDRRADLQIWILLDRAGSRLSRPCACQRRGAFAEHAPAVGSDGGSFAMAGGWWGRSAPARIPWFALRADFAGKEGAPPCRQVRYTGLAKSGHGRRDLCASGADHPARRRHSRDGGIPGAAFSRS
jgi:hypothetical protein